jgi:hypothetical protein
VHAHRPMALEIIIARQLQCTVDVASLAAFVNVAHTPRELHAAHKFLKLCLMVLQKCLNYALVKLKETQDRPGPIQGVGCNLLQKLLHVEYGLFCVFAEYFCDTHVVLGLSPFVCHWIQVLPCECSLDDVVRNLWTNRNAKTIRLL